MTLKTLLEGTKVDNLNGYRDIEIKGLCADSRKVSPGDLYIALKGDNFDGRDFIEDAVRKGASAIVAEGTQSDRHGAVPLIRVEDARQALALISNNFFERPSEKLCIIGVTGTNGKTTTTHLIKSVLEAAGHKSGLIGTISYMIGENVYPAPYTTPEAIEFQGLLSDMNRSGMSHVVTEVSSHALSQKRVDGTRFEAAVFTNLTRDHLDFHGTMENYFEAKKRLFTELLSGKAVINIDDPYGKRLRDSIKGKTITYSIEGDAGVKAVGISNTSKGLSFNASAKRRDIKIESPLIGMHNAYNILAAVGAAIALGIDNKAIAKGIKDVRLVSGRFERVDCGQDFLCVIDYAHTDDALMRLIQTARQVTKGRIITVFGCGGQRDRGKRPLMGAIAAELSDMVFITSDNPRNEDPLEIINEIKAGIKKDNFKVVPDRREAIFAAIGAAGPSDTVLIAGKGHEDYQIVGDKKLHFSDRQMAEAAIREIKR